MGVFGLDLSVLELVPLSLFSIHQDLYLHRNPRNSGKSYNTTLIHTEEIKYIFANIYTCVICIFPKLSSRKDVVGSRKGCTIKREYDIVFLLQILVLHHIYATPLTALCSAGSETCTPDVLLLCDSEALQLSSSRFIRLGIRSSSK